MKKNNNANVDLLGIGGGSGNVAKQLMANGNLNIGAMRPFIDENTGRAYMTVYQGGNPKSPSSYKTIPLNANATLRRDEWKQLDEALLDVSRTRLNGIQDLIDNNLTYNLGNAMGTTVLEYHDVSDAFEADLTMDGITRAKNDRPDFNYHYLPIPIIHVDYEINARELAASRNLGNALDTIDAQLAARKVAEKLESMLFTNTTYAWGEKGSDARNSIYSYINHPDRNLVSLGTPWSSLDYDSSTASGGKRILAQVMAMKAASLADLHYGPWMLYIPSSYEVILDQDYEQTTSSGKSIRERLLQIAGIKGVKTIDTLPANNVLLVQMTTDVVRLVRGII